MIVPLADLRRGDWLRLMLGFFWRGLVYAVACALAGGIGGGVVGGVLGGAMAARGASVDAIQVLVRPIGALVGLGLGFAGLRPYIGWLLSARYGAVRLAIIRTDRDR